MDVEQRYWTAANGWNSAQPGPVGASATLVFVFGAPILLHSSACLRDVVAAYPHAHIVGCSTAGEIYDTHVWDDTVVVTALRFADTQVRIARTSLLPDCSSYDSGCILATELTLPDLVHVVVFSDGIHVNGSDLVRGLLERLPNTVTVTGGLAGDGPRFTRTFVCDGGRVEERQIVAIGFYSRSLRVGFGSLGGWDPFGPERLITRAAGNVLYELDGHSALALYKQYLGPYSADLPASGLLFPLSLRDTAGGPGIVRTILGVNEADQSITFAGDMPEGVYARLMKANFDRLIDGATTAARASYESLDETSPDFALLISCVGRKLVLKQRVEEEVESVRTVLGDRTALLGFYSYGEISPLTPDARCALHNQTMSITTFVEP